MTVPSSPSVSGAPLVSVITPVWNAETTLAGTVASVRAQSLPDWEMLLVNDGSTDGSAACMRELAAREKRLRLMGWADNRGAAAARNAAIRAARGRFIAFLDADDLWLPGKLAVQTGYMARTGATLVFSAYERMDAAGRPLGRVGVPARVTRERLLRGNVIGCLTAIYDTARFGRAEMPGLRRRQDYGLWLDLLSREPEAHGIDEVLARYRVRPASLSGNKLRALAATWALYRGPAGLGRLPAARCLAANALSAARRRLGG